VELDSYEPLQEQLDAVPIAVDQPAGEPATALDILLDGVESRVSRRGRP
jgi:hypothetical protein